MLDNQLIKLIINIILGQATIAGIPAIKVKAGYQPTRQGVETIPSAYMFKVSDKRLGYPYRPNTWGDEVNAAFTGSISGDTLNVTAMDSGALTLGMTLSGDDIDDGAIWITGFGTGAGQTGTYTLNQKFTLDSQAINGIAGMTNQTTQQYETTFQIMTLATQNASTPNQQTASDILNAIAYILQSDSTVEILEAQGIGILRVMDVRNAPFVDDRDRFEFGPSFDFTLTHKQVISSTVPILQSEEVNIYSV